MHDSDTNTYKIGISKSPEFREGTLRPGVPKVTTIKHVLFDSRTEAKKYETELHNRYKIHRVRGEWFSLNQNILEDLIKEFEITYEQNRKSKKEK